jgi:N-carbamoyl-L-amino-acid hydrolase
MKISDEALKNCFDIERMQNLIESFALIGKDPNGGVTRLAFSREDRQAREAFVQLLRKDFDLQIRSDALGNIFARREGRHPQLPVIMTGSHLDSVKNGGKFDGPAGVFASLEAFRALDQLGLQTEHPFELCVFCSEEPNPFGISTFGSRGMVGKLEKTDVEHLTDDHGNDFASALKSIGGDLDRIDSAVRPPEDISAFLELHIEQMPFLEAEQKDIGIVEGVTGIYRESITVNGEASHGGTTPMDRRRDALCAASEIILGLEAAAAEEGKEAVATIGHISVFPNSINITPETVVLDAEIRSYHAASITRILKKLENVIHSVKDLRKIDIERQVTYNNPPIQFSSSIKRAIAEAAQSLGFSSLSQVSMAGHDAAHVRQVAEAGMIFIPCRSGLSHCPEEHTEIEHLVKGAQCLLKALLILDQPQKEVQP